MSLALSFSRLCIQNVSRALQRTGQSYIHTTPVFFGEPMRKKKRIDPAIIKAREHRRKRKLEKAIRQLAKHARQYKPLDEMEVSFALLDEKETRTRPAVQITEDEEDRRALLQKEWSRHKRAVAAEQSQLIDKLLKSQEKALKELRVVSDELYQAAIQPDQKALPVVVKGPDGDYTNVSKKWE